MNKKIIDFLKGVIFRKGVKYVFVSEKSGIAYQRLMRIFNQKSRISGSELICLCKVLDVKQSDLMSLLENNS